MRKRQFVAPVPGDSPEVFRTPSGSRLYGLDHEHSDHDIFVVTTSTLRTITHDVRDDGDFTHRGIYEFLRRVASGSHQACEAAFSREKVFTIQGVAWRPIIESMRVTEAEALTKYERTLKNFCFGDFKRRRHAVRLSFDLADLRTNGRFEPRMTDAQITLANALANDLRDHDLAERLIPGDHLKFDTARIRQLRVRFGVDD